MMEINLTHLSKSALQSLIWTLLSLMAEVIVYLILVYKGTLAPQVINGSMGLFTLGVVNALCCFFIVKHSPVSIFFVPLVMNSFILVIAFLNSASDPWWLPVASGLILCLMASIIGLLIRKRFPFSNNPFQRVKSQ